MQSGFRDEGFPRGSRRRRRPCLRKRALRQTRRFCGSCTVRRGSAVQPCCWDCRQRSSTHVHARSQACKQLKSATYRSLLCTSLSLDAASCGWMHNQPIHLWDSLFVTLSSIRERNNRSQKGSPQVNRLVRNQNKHQLIIYLFANKIEGHQLPLVVSLISAAGPAFWWQWLPTVWRAPTPSAAAL